LHILAGDVIVEVVDSEGEPLPPGKRGRLLITSLHNYGMPFIRYDLGDEAALMTGTCPCGRTLPRLGVLVGRKTRFFVTRSGRRVFAGTLYLDRLAALGMRQYQLVQEDIDHVVMRRVPPPRVTSSSELASLEAQVRHLFEAGFGPELSLRVELIDRIEPTEAGKHVYMYSRVTDGGLAPPSAKQPGAQRDEQ